MDTSWKEFFTFSRSEKRGIFILSLLILFITLFRYLWPSFQNNEIQTSHRFSDEVERFIRIQDSIDSVKQESAARFKIYKPKENSFAKNENSNRSTYKSKEKNNKPAADFKLDINLADSIDLLKLPGIGPVFAGRIIKYRKMLGGFHDRTQLLEVYGMDSTRMASFESYIVIDSNRLRKYNLNDVGFKELLRHPYFNYELVKALFNYKDKHDLRSVNEILLIDVINDTLFKKISPYLEVKK